MTRFITFISFYLLYCITASAQCSDRYIEMTSDTFILHKDIYFGENIAENGDLFELFLDVFEPVENNGELRPMVIMIHGGSFTGGEKEMGEVVWLCEDLARRGIVTASINYRTESDPLSLISEEKMVKAVIRAVEDTKASARFFYKHVSEGNSWSIDPGSIFYGGTSAGSIAALHAVFMDDYTSLKPKWKNWINDLGIDTINIDGNSGNPGFADSVAGVINISGAIAELDFLNNNTDIPVLSIHNSVDLSIPYQFGHPYFIPTLPIIAGSRPIHLRLRSLDANSTLMTFNALNHVPHTHLFEGFKLVPEYNQILEGILQFIGENVPCDALPTAILNDNVKILKAYPNPVSWSSGVIRIEGIEIGPNFVFELFDVSGSRIANDISANAQQIHLQSLLLSPGIYFLIGEDRLSHEQFLLQFIVSR